MSEAEAIQRMRAAIRLRHFSFSTERSYCGWLRRYIRFLAHLPAATSEQKLEAYLSHLARQGISASTQNQAFSALVFFYQQVLRLSLKKIDALRAKVPARVREAPTREETRALLAAVPDLYGYPCRLIVRLIYGCGLRVTEPLNLRIKDIGLSARQLVIRAAKGGKDRVVALPKALGADLAIQIEAARIIWKSDLANQLPLWLPHHLARKYPRSRFAWKWAWLFPAASPCRHPRTQEWVRYRMHEANIQRAVRQACRQVGLAILPHELRHAYATHSLNRGINPRAIQQVMGHKSLETTMGYFHAENLSVPSPLDQ